MSRSLLLKLRQASELGAVVCSNPTAIKSFLLRFLEVINTRCPRGPEGFVGGWDDHNPHFEYVAKIRPNQA